MNYVLTVCFTLADHMLYWSGSTEGKYRCNCGFGGCLFDEISGCFHSPCTNGKCTDLSEHYLCECPPNHYGMLRRLKMSLQLLCYFILGYPHIKNALTYKQYRFLILSRHLKCANIFNLDLCFNPAIVI